MEVMVQQLKELSIALEEGKKECDRLVYTVSDPKVRKSILGIELQSVLYASELKEQIQQLGGSVELEPVEIPLKPNRTKESKNLEKEVIGICRNIERSVIKFYGRLLQAQIENDGLRQLIRSQMNGKMRSTMHLKLLSKLVYTG